MNKSFDQYWEKLFENNWGGKYPREEVIQFVATNYYACERKGVKILDFGSGIGAQTWYLAREGFETYAFDGSKSAIEQLKYNMQKENLKIHAIVCDAIELPYENNYFDAVIDSAVIYANKIENIVKMYKKIYAILKNSGRLLTTSLWTSNTTGFGSGKEIEKNTYTDIEKGPLAGGQTAHFFSYNEIYELLSEIGFLDLKISITTKRNYSKSLVMEYITVDARK